MIVEGVKSGVNIALNDGNDRLKVVNPRPTDGTPFGPQVNLPGAVNIDQGAFGGDTTLYVVNHQRMNVELGSDGSRLAIHGSEIFDLRVHGSGRADRIELNNLRSRGNVWVYAGGASIASSSSTSTPISAGRRSFRRWAGPTWTRRQRCLYQARRLAAYRIDQRLGTRPAAVRR